MRILLITGDKEVAASIRRALADASFTPTSTGDGERGLRLALRGTFAAVILDAASPRFEAVALCSRLRAARVTTPVLALMGWQDPRERVRTLESGADDCLCKPFEVAELLARLRALIRRDQVLKSTKLVIDDLVVDTAARTVTRAGRDVTLTHREFTLLEALATREAQVVTRAEIQGEVWGDAYSSSNTVDVHIRSLRRKIDCAQRRRLIHTVFGRGYLLSAQPGPADEG